MLFCKCDPLLRLHPEHLGCPVVFPTAAAPSLKQLNRRKRCWLTFSSLRDALPPALQSSSSEAGGRRRNMEVPLLLFFLLWRSSCACEYRVSGRAEASVSGNKRLIVNFTDFIAGTSREATTDSLITPVCSDSLIRKNFLSLSVYEKLWLLHFPARTAVKLGRKDEIKLKVDPLITSQLSITFQ